MITPERLFWRFNRQSHETCENMSAETNMDSDCSSAKTDKVICGFGPARDGLSESTIAPIPNPVMARLIPM